MAATAESTASSPLAYFLAGMLVPTIAYFFLNRKGNDTGGNNTSSIDLGEDDWDDDSDDGAPLPTGSNNPSSSWGMMDAPYKMVLCVNTSLGMGKGEY